MPSRNRNPTGFPKENQFNQSSKILLEKGISGQNIDKNKNNINRDKVICKNRYSTGGMKSSRNRRNSLASQFGGSQGTTVESSLNASETPSGTSLFGGNVWDRLLRPKKADLWEGYGKDAYADDGDSVISLLSDCEEEPNKQCLSLLQDCLNVTGHETRHFVLTAIKHPVVLLGALFVFGLVFGVGYAAIDSQRCASVSKSKHTATWIATETAGWFQKQFEDLMKPLFSIQQGVIHSGYFDDLPAKIGPYPNRVIPNMTKVTRNVTGICDDEDLQEKFRSIVEPINKDCQLEGIAVAYRLYPANVMCLAEPMINTKDFPPGIVFDNSKRLGYDSGHDHSKFWADTVIDMFVDKNPNVNVFGPFTSKAMPEAFCGHLPIWTKPSNPTVLDVQGHKVENAYGFVMNFIHWQRLKDRSNIYERFADCNLEFCLTRNDGFDKDGNPDIASIAESPNCNLLNDENSIVVSVQTSNGQWDNRVGSLKGWEPNWYPMAVAFVTICALLSSLLTAGVLVQRLLHKKLLYKVMPKGAIAKLQRGQTVVEKYDIVTIFFSDIVSFTSMAGEMRPIQVMRMLNDLYIQFDKLVKKHGVYKVETIGDAYMVVGGAPDRRPSPEAAERVALFALDAIDFVKDFRTKAGDRIFIRAGLASGPVVAGVVGDAMPRYCFFGDTVNFASRMESTSSQMKIQCSDLTSRLLRDAPKHHFELQERREGNTVGVQVKGKGMIHTWWIKKASVRTSIPKEELGWLPDIETSVPEVNFCKESSSTVDSSDHEFDNIEFKPQKFLRRNSSMSHDWATLGFDKVEFDSAVDSNSILIDRITYILSNYAICCNNTNSGNASLPLIAREQLREFVATIEKTYEKNHFHSFLHAYHALISMDKLIQVHIREYDTNMFSAPISDFPLIPFALIFGALIHDAGHTGMSNKILIEQKHPLAEGCSEDDPVAEQHSYMLGIELFFSKQFEEIRKIVLPTEVHQIRFCKALIHSVLSTDITSKSRNELVKQRYQKFIAQSVDSSLKISDIKCPHSHHLEQILTKLNLYSSCIEKYPEEFLITSQTFKWCIFVEHTMLVSDIAHLMQCWGNFVTWNFRLFQEINACHKKSLCNDPYNGWYKGEIWFLENYVIPLAERYKVFFSSNFGEINVENAKRNLETWRKVGNEAANLMLSAVNDGEQENVTLMKLKQLSS